MFTNHQPGISTSVGAAILLLLCVSCASDCEPSGEPVTWLFDNLESIGGHAVEVLGAPTVIDGPGGRALQFDGIDDGIYIDMHPLAGATTFTAEVIFRPDPGGAEEQRFFHLQENDSRNRVMFETRLRRNLWFLDTYLRYGDHRHTLYAEDFKHTTGLWYHAAIVVDGNEIRHYVNGKPELAMPVNFRCHGAGRTSVGMRINQVHWFKGAVQQARFTRRALDPAEFLAVPR